MIILSRYVHQITYRDIIKSILSKTSLQRTPPNNGHYIARPKGVHYSEVPLYIIIGLLLGLVYVCQIDCRAPTRRQPRPLLLKATPTKHAHKATPIKQSSVGVPCGCGLIFIESFPFPCFLSTLCYHQVCPRNN